MSIEPHRLEFVHTAAPPLASDSAVQASLPHRLSPSSDSIAVLVDGRARPGWHFALFVADASHIGCVAKGPHADAVDHHRRAAGLGRADDDDETDAYVACDKDSGAVSAYCYAQRHAAAMRRTACALFEVTPHTEIDRIRVEKWALDGDGAESSM